MFEHRKIEVAEFIFDPKVSLAPAGASRSEPCYLARNWRSDTKLHFPSFPSPFITSYHITHTAILTFNLLSLSPFLGGSLPLLDDVASSGEAT